MKLQRNYDLCGLVCMTSTLRNKRLFNTAKLFIDRKLQTVFLNRLLHGNEIMQYFKDNKCYVDEKQFRNAIIKFFKVHEKEQP